MRFRKSQLYLLYRIFNKIEYVFKKSRNNVLPQSEEVSNLADNYKTFFKYIICIIIFYLCWTYNICAYARTVSFDGFEYPIYVSNKFNYLKLNYFINIK